MAFNANNGTSIWNSSYLNGTHYRSSPAVSEDNKLFFGTSGPDGRLYIINTTDGGLYMHLF